MSYRKTLELCDEHGISIYDAMIANEVDFFFPDRLRVKKESFEQLCELASEAYLKVDCTTSLSQVVSSLRDLILKGKDINTITHHDIIENIEY